MGPHMLGNGPHMFDNGPHVLGKSTFGTVLYVAFGIWSHSVLCRIRGYVVRHNVAFGLMSFGIVSFGLMLFGLMSFGVMLFGLLSVYPKFC